MKFGKQILSQQISGWGSYYLDYKSLKKIINSLEKGRLGDAALFASGLRPSFSSSSSASDVAAHPLDDASAQQQAISTLTAGGEPAAMNGVGTNAQILAPSANGRSGGARHGEMGDELRIHKAAFFFKLERELEKINAFYLSKEAELKVRLRTLVDKRQVLLARRGGAAKMTKESPSFYALYEGFRYFEKDLSKLQQFIEINATGFRKILKKWDKRSKSQTKELYLARQVEVQPCFNREFIAELSDIAAANLLELEHISERGVSRGPDGISPSGLMRDDLSSEKRLDFAAARSQEVDVLSDLEENLLQAVRSGRTAAAREMATAACQSEDATSVARIVWRALLDAPPAAVQAAMNSGLPDYAFVDDINSRTSLHETALAGNLQLVCACVQSGIDVRRRDIYGRTALSYAAMSGHADVCTYLLSLDAVDASSADLDGFSPLVLAVMSGQVEVVRILLAHGVSVEAAGTSDLIPLCLASQGGHAEITQMLLQRGAKLAVANPEGLTPQALAAREGHAECLSLLMSAGADRDALEKGTLWTPLFFAAESGHASCVRILLDAGARVDASDEKSRTAAFYAAWRGQIDCLLLLLDAGRKAAEAAAAAAAAAGSKSRGRDELSPKAARKKSRESEELEQLDLDMEMDGIPSLSLPPPIIPFRTYGHNYLDKRALVTVSLTNSSVKLYKLQDPNRPEQFSTSSLKLVMTSRPDASTTTIPHTIFLPLADDREVFSFQVDGLERFYLEWELMPTFGSKVIGKAVALPSSFDGMTDRKRFTLPLQDVYLKIVGEVSFELDFVKPFDGVQLEIGGRVETYWKSTLPTSAAAAAAAAMDSATPSGSRQTPTSLSASTSDAPVAVSAGGAAANALAAESYVTASSLSGQHLRVAVQVTKDGVAVVYPAFTLPVQELDVYVGSVTGAQFASLAKSTGRALQVPPERRDSLSLQEWKTALQRSMVTLDELLEMLPVSVGIDLDVLYPSSADVRGNPSLPKIEVNHFVDAILHAVYRAGTQNRQQSRKILFSSRSPTVCTALNWKQPNYAVFFASYCGLARTSDSDTLLAPCDRGEPDPRRQSVAEAVRFAKSNNLLGIMVDAVILNHVPQLIHSIKAAGLLLITIGQLDAALLPTAGDSAAARHTADAPTDAPSPDASVDGAVQDGIVSC